MNRKFNRVVLFVLLFAMVLSLSAFAGTPKTKVSIQTAPTVSGVATAGYALSQLTLNGGAAVDSDGNPVDGKFVWSNGGEILEAGVYTRSYTFIPTDKDTYACASGYVTVKAYRLTPTVQMLPEVEGKLGVDEKVSELKLSGGKAVNHYTRNRAVVEGHFEFADPDQKFDKAGTYEIPVVFKPDDTLRFNDSVYTYVRTCKNGPFKAAAVTVTVG